MSYAQLDFLADNVNLVLALGLIVGAFWMRRAAAWQFLLRVILATALVQQSAKLFQKVGWLGPHFPSTHFAVALCLATFWILLQRKLWPVALAVVVAYGALMLYQKYHTPLEMLGALYAVPLSLFVGTWSWRQRAVSRQN